MTSKTYSRLDLAEFQLESAIGLFVSGGDRFSVITLAGAADVILSQLLVIRGVENFTEYAQKCERQRGGSAEGTKEVYGQGINDLLCINQIKHMDDGEGGFIEINPEECAIGAILKAITNHVVIVGGRKSFVQAFLAWVKLNLDPERFNIHCDPDWKPSSDDN
jgi:hypothetical protein